ncbi:ribbon-helix-helix protein, CopG family [Hydrocarboniphaga sp.]|uniref:ribbon-helix-helix protein, CopG family n=1 Tax=Hydrocarboniphaga sp. TaxID=2033016 RepID=UPI002619908E|nr:ribbon-helix-helix protein, CopG family [Hydrocarboniphaga sp.]
MRALTIRLPDDLEKQLARAARAAKKNRSEFVRDLIADAFRRQERDALSGWRE